MTASMSYLEQEQIREIVDNTPTLRDHLIIRLLWRSGIRVSELINIEVGDVDFAGERIRISHLKTRSTLRCPHCAARLGKSHAFCQGCGRKVTKAERAERKEQRHRWVPVDKHTLDLIDQYVQARGDFGLLFPLSRQAVWSIVKDAAEAAGLGGKILKPDENLQPHRISPHRLRDAFAVRAVKQDDSGDGLRLLQDHLGHVNIGTTMKYRKIAGQESKEWYERVFPDD